MGSGRRIAAAALLLAGAAPALAERSVPALTGPVVDEAGILDSRWRGELESMCRAAWALPADRRVQLQYLLVDSLEGDAIEPYAVRVFEKWKLGERGRDNGVLVVVAVKDRRVRIETGYGTEGALTDAQAGRIIRDTLTPAFRQGGYGEGLHAAGRQILGALGALPAGAEPGGRAEPRAVRVPILGPLFGFLLLLGSPFILFLVVAFIILRLLFGRRRWGGGGGFGGGWGAGGGGWSGGGGGGWSGGGGGSGGGGASGSW